MKDPLRLRWRYGPVLIAIFIVMAVVLSISEWMMATL